MGRPVAMLMVGLQLVAACTKHRSAADAQGDPHRAPEDGAADAAVGDAARHAGGASSDAGDTAPGDAQMGGADDAGLPRFSSHCHGLQRGRCDGDAACGWATGAIGANIAAGCYALCPVSDGGCAPRASCELVRADDAQCGRVVCLPTEVLPVECGQTIPCAGDAATLCWRQRPEHCGDCDSCVDEELPILCFVDAGRRRHWMGQPSQGDLLLDANWTTCENRPTPLSCD